MNNVLSKNRFVALLLASLAFSFLVLGQILNSDYFGDDLYNFQVHGAVPYYFDSIWEMNVHFFKQWINIGRFYPFSYYAYTVFYYLDDVVYYKLFLLLMTLLAVVSFSWVVYLFSKNKWVALIVLVITPVLFQYRFYLDPFLSFHGLIQLVAIEIFLSVGLFKLFLDTEKKRYLFLSIMFWLASLLTYEITYPFILMYLWLSLRSEKPVKVAAGYVLVFLAVISIIAWLRLTAQAASIAYTPDFDIWNILKTWFFQVVSVLPGSYYLVSPIPSLKPIGFYFVLAIVLTYFLYKLTSFKEGTKFSDKKALVYLSLILLTLPGLMISFSPKYQSQISFGFAYLPIFIQYFGLSALIGIFIYQVNNMILKLVAIIGMAAILVVHQSANESVVGMVNAPYKNERHVLALFYGNEKIQNVIQDDDMICFKNITPLNTKEFISLYTHKKVVAATKDNKLCKFDFDFRLTRKDASVSLLNRKTHKLFELHFIKNKKAKWTLDQG